ncbi:succinate-semialdehyde dehydrogenase, mitochondrial [Agrilus planipennis]|uniref:Succinate-semialdehyde dehydrogenase, mitochondrial n=1 Tax=Agrilus planipennis TaxID=224129 RepID=A0A1W4WJA1_AGRPL|nr:succinate-semialdehyde dehydrogenase, mitochondrial [Agrilus planipennis]
MLSYCSKTVILSCKNSNFKNIQLINKQIRLYSGSTFDVLNPVNGTVVGTVPDMTIDEIKEKVEKASDAHHEWKLTTAKHRAGLLRKWFNLLEQNSADIAKTLSKEAGKPFNEAVGEVAYGNSFVEWSSEEARTVLGQIIPSPYKSKKILVEKHPIGVVGIITPWNFPHAMITRKAGAALAAGCTCVIKPAAETPLTAITLTQLAHEAGIPENVMNVVTVNVNKASQVGTLFCTSPLIAGISFTGSTVVGKILYRLCADHVKRISLELGGNAPFIIFDSADIDKAVEAALVAKFRNCGQTCVAANRFLVQSGIYDKFVAALTEKVKKLRMGDVSQPDVQLGPLINSKQFNTVTRFVEDAISKGAKVLLGGKAATHIGQLFYEPTILADIKPDMKVYNEEIFGPVVPLIQFKKEEEAIKIANSTMAGLAGYLCSSDVNQIFRVSKLLETGMVGINEGLISMAEAPFGGIKDSGIGREGSIYGIDEFLYVKYYCLGGLD